MPIAHLLPGVGEVGGQTFCVAVAFAHPGQQAGARIRLWRWQAIGARAAALGLWSDPQPPSDAQAAALILQPGLSTASSVDQVSGRGIGMDAVLAQVLQLGGQLHIDSRSGQGCCMRITLPAPARIETLQAMHHTAEIVQEMLRVGREVIVTFPNFGYWRNRLQILTGNMPVSKTLPYQWFDTPNVHLCTISDFDQFCKNHNITVLERRVITDTQAVEFMPNLLGNLAMYRLKASS